MSGTITKVSGPLVVAKGLADANVSDVVRVGSQRLIGEILNMTGDQASIQVYEETSGLGPGAVVETTGMPMSVELGPGMLDNIYDGIQRPLPEMRALTGDSITRGTDVPALNRKKQWVFVPVAKRGQKVNPGDVLGTVQETSAILHKIMVPNGIHGEVVSVGEGKHVVTDVIAVVKDDKGVKHPFLVYVDDLIDAVDIPVVLGGSLREMAKINDVLNNSKVEFVSMSKPFVAQADFLADWKRDGEGTAICYSCNNCYSKKTSTCFKHF